jgi:ferrochelatase
MDPGVIRLPWPLRWFLVHVLIVPRRRYASARLYRNIWTDQGSPLMVHSRALEAKVRRLVSQAPLELAMRYGEPSVSQALAKLKETGIKRLRLVPLYPQYTSSTFESSLLAVQEAAARVLPEVTLEVVAPYFEHDGYLEALRDSLDRALRDFAADHVLFSFHGVPEAHVRETDPTGIHCLKREHCCNEFRNTNPLCYRAQCFHTANEVARRSGLDAGRYSVVFQSRLGRNAWLTPATDDVIKSLGRAGKKKVLVICPSFAADCLETLEEIALRGDEVFKESGGESLRLVPALNSNDDWAKVVAWLATSGPLHRPHQTGQQLPQVARAH